MTPQWRRRPAAWKVSALISLVMDSNRPMLLAGGILFAMGLVIGVAIGSATAVSALTQGGPDVLQNWSGVVAMP